MKSRSKYMYVAYLRTCTQNMTKEYEKHTYRHCSSSWRENAAIRAYDTQTLLNTEE